MSAFGENLRREREMRGVSLEEISAATKISMRFLESIEREDFSKLPGGIFSRSFIRSYARYLGLDEDRMVADFQLAAQPQEEFDLHRMVAGSSNATRPPKRTPLVATLVAVVLLAGGYLLFRYSRQAADTPVPPPPVPVAIPKPTTAAPSGEPCTEAPGVPVPGVGDVAPGTPRAAKSNCIPGQPSTAPITGDAAPGATPGTAANPSGANSNPQAGPTAAAPAAGVSPTAPAGALPIAKPVSDSELVLQVAATERSWVSVDADGKTVLQRVLNPDEVQTLKAHKAFDVTTGNAQAVILTLNGETLKPLGRRGEVKRVHLTHDDLKNSTP